MPLVIDPPLLNSANPWATSLEDLQSLYNHPCTGAVTTRTSLLSGFGHDSKYHNYIFFDTNKHNAVWGGGKFAEASDAASLNTLGYSPIALDGYLGFIKQIAADGGKKPFIVSVTGSVSEVVECYRRIMALQEQIQTPLAMEINLSCPNIPDKPPPAYDAVSLGEYISALGEEQKRYATEKLGQEIKGGKGGSMSKELEEGTKVRNAMVPIGIKTPPYTYSDQFKTLITALCSGQTHTGACPVSFVTATNTLGTSLVLSGPIDKEGIVPFATACMSYDSSGIGGMAGTPLHPLALGNVFQLTKHLKDHPYTKHIQVIGVGGVQDSDGYRRMRHVGASAVGVGTALGRIGLDVFNQIADGIKEKW